jgi:hypothetical protein
MYPRTGIEDDRSSPQTLSRILRNPAEANAVRESEPGVSPELLALPGTPGLK